MSEANFIRNKIAVFFIGIFLILLASCSSAYNLTDKSGNIFVIENPKLETEGNLEYRTGSAVIYLAVKDIISLSIPNAEQKIFDGRLFYPATLRLKDTVSVPAQGFICVEGIVAAKNAGKKFSIPFADIRELSRSKKEEPKEEIKEEIKKEPEEEPKQEKSEEETEN